MASRSESAAAGVALGAGPAGAQLCTKRAAPALSSVTLRIVIPPREIVADHAGRPALAYSVRPRCQGTAYGPPIASRSKTLTQGMNVSMRRFSRGRRRRAVDNLLYRR